MAKRMNNTEERKKQILDVAEELFLKGGYYGVNVDDVAAGAGVVRGTILHYFGTKENLYQCVLNHKADESVGLLLTLMTADDQSVPDILRTFLYFIQKMFRDSKKDTDRCFEDSAMRYQYDAIRISIYYRLLEAFEKLIERGNEEGVLRIVNPRARASSVLFAIFGLTGESISTIEVTAELYDLVEKMLEIKLR